MSHSPRDSSTEFDGSQYDSDEEIDENQLTEVTPLTAANGQAPPTNNRHDSWITFKTRLRYYVPVFSWLPTYSIHTFCEDFLAGLTVTAILLPSSLSYSVLAKLPPVHGLYSVVIPGILYSFLGTSRQLVIGPEALVSMLTGSSVSQQLHYMDGESRPEDAILIAGLITFFVGILTFILGIVRLGFLDSVLSRALLRGFISAVAIVIMIEQFLTMFQLTEEAAKDGIGRASSSVQIFIYIVTHFNRAHVLTTIVSFSSLIFLLITGFIKKKLSKRWPQVQFIPEILICVIIFTILCNIFNWDKDGVDILGSIKGGGFPSFQIPYPPSGIHIMDCFEAAALISVIGFVESIVVTKTYATKHNYAVSANRELVALGTANLVGSFFQCFAAYGGMARSGINDRAGARTQLSGLINAILVLLCLFFLLNAFYYLPKPVLASIVTVAAISLLEELPHDLYFMYKIKAWKDYALLFLTFFSTIFISIEYGTLISVALSLILVVKHSTYPRITLLGRIGNTDKFKPIKDFPDQAEHVKGVLVVRIAEPLYFANTGQLKDRLRRLEEFGDMNVHPSEESRMSPIENVIFDIETMEDVDASAAQILLEIVVAYHQRGVNVFFVKLRENQKKLFKRAGIMNKVGSDRFFKRIPDALEYINRLGLNIE
ncbi:sulfate transporter family-domain-containing protein [Glomus cerebriforme]|uniref:Sulfate transporter family-domain-containing protein n=1 Tax=Glomus cerebriforme TaxID=658196 RepID=A0A397TR77_9GLOM|nr:sulfate transporter family-domain-containing protein [Glomus cerebriforme]